MIDKATEILSNRKVAFALTLIVVMGAWRFMMEGLDVE